MITTPPNNAMKLTRGGLERGRGVVTASRPGVAGFQDLGRGARPSQLIASVRRTLRRKTELSKLTEAE